MNYSRLSEKLFSQISSPHPDVSKYFCKEGSIGSQGKKVGSKIFLKKWLEIIGKVLKTRLLNSLENANKANNSENSTTRRTFWLTFPRGDCVVLKCSWFSPREKFRTFVIDIDRQTNIGQELFINYLYKKSKAMPRG